MNFEEFKKRYIAKLERGGFVVPQEGSDEHLDFMDRMAEIYLGLQIFSDWQNEEIEKQMQQQKKPEKKIYVPNNGIIQ